MSGTRARTLVGGTAALLFSIALDAWIRVLLVTAYRKDGPTRVAGVNRLFHLWGSGTFAIFRHALAVRVRVEGTAPTSGRFLVVCNHQSSLDIPALMALLPGLNLKFVAMEPLRHGAPCVSVALRHGGCAFVAKRDLGADLAAIRRFASDLPRHVGSPVIFPEGRRTDDGSLLPFQAAGMEVIRATAKLPLLPVTIDGLRSARSLRELPEIVGKTVTIRFGDPVPSEEIARDPRSGYRRLEDAMRASLESIRSGAGN